ncbi:MAG: SNF2-related protein [Nitrospiraceae bacterium]|nr:SNF2-related protein [Nitrospiraceae bacterium]
MSWDLAEICEGVNLLAGDSGVLIRGDNKNLAVPETLHALKPKTRLGRLLPVLIPQLLEMDLADVENGAVRLPYDLFVDIEENEIDAFQDVVQWSPFSLEVQTTGTMGASDFKYKVRFYFGNEPIYIERKGCFVKRGDIIYRLDKQTFSLVETVDNFNALPVEKKSTPENVLIIFASIKGLSEDIGAQIDKIISHQKVIIPSKIGLDMLVDENKRITFVPKIDGASPEGLRKAFLVNDDIDDVYSVKTPEGGRIRILLNQNQKEVFRRMQKVRHLGGAARSKILSNPFQIFDGVAEDVDIDLSEFGPRVKGIGDFPFVANPFVSYGTTGIFEGSEAESSQREKKRFDIGINVAYADGTEENVIFRAREEVLKFNHELKVAVQKGASNITVKGKTIQLTKDFVKGVEDIVEDILTPPKKDEPQSKKHHYLLIYTNVEKLEYNENEDTECEMIGEDKFCIPSSLRDDITLREHQKAGLRWLQLNYLRKRRGCLLADEMGLGKTLQVLSFLSWLIERGDISPAGVNKETAPWNPILIVAPVMLLESETWIKDMQAFFLDTGIVFEPFLVLHGNELKRMRRPHIHGREVEMEESVLDLDKLCQYRVVLTNYETIVNYQFSFASMKDKWSVIVTDESQELKTPNTKISHAMKSLSPTFRVACTGTPVETRLMDIWNIFDYLQPGRLGSSAEFSKQFDKPISSCAGRETLSATLGELRERLYYGKPYAFILRRDKSKLTDLPVKYEHKEDCDLGDEQKEKHFDFVTRARSGGNGNDHLRMIHNLMKLYQHPSLLPEYSGLESCDIEGALKRCPKLEKVISILTDIRAKREKVLIFTRSLAMQDVLARVILKRFGINVDIINGGTSRKMGTMSTNNTRKGILQRFQGSHGFNVLILSPDVAGVGITLVEANHVIHYGRWWNPAKESQATDRVYRIGQSKDVHVYYLIAKDPLGKFKTFDEKLDALLQRRKELAADFLAPMPDEGALGNELFEDIMGDDIKGARSKPLSKEEIRSLPWQRFESLVGLLETKRNKKVILTPGTADDGIDVVSIGKGIALLIQCKHHINWDTSVDADVISDITNAVVNYRCKWLDSIIGKLSLKPILVTNGKFTNSAKSLAMMQDVQLISGSDLWKLIEKTPCTLAEIEMLESNRLSSMKCFKEEVRKIYEEF